MIIKKIKAIYKSEWKNYNVWWYWNWNRFHQHKKSISIDNIAINKTVEYNQVFFGKKYFKYFIG